MNTGTGALRELAPDERLAHVEDLEAIEQLRGEVPPEVEVPASYLPLTPEQRLALAFGYRGGKDRRAQGRPGVTTKAERRARRRRAKVSRQRNRR